MATTVEMTHSENPTLRFKQVIVTPIRLGKPIHISPKSHACLNKEGYELKIFTESVTVCIGIGKDHTAELVMTKAAFEALQEGQPIDITTTEQFKARYIRKTRVEA
jgi:hypothetical protein